MKQLLRLTLLLALALSMGSCRKAMQKTASKIKLEAVESVTPKGLTSLEAVLRVANGSSHALSLENASITIHHQQSSVLILSLHDPVAIGKRTTASLPTRWRMQISDPLALLLLARDVRAGDPSKISISYAIDGRGGPARVNLRREKVPLSEFLRTFGVSMDDLKNYLPL